MGILTADMKRIVEEQRLENAGIEINVVDPFVRKGYRFKGVATILESGPSYDEAIRFYEARGSVVRLIREVVLTRS